MKRITYVGDIAFVRDDSPDYDDPQVQRRLDNLLKVAISISIRKGMINASHGCPHLETKPLEVLSSEDLLRRRPGKRQRENPHRKR